MIIVMRLRRATASLQLFVIFLLFFLIQYLSRGIQFSRASLNGALTKHKNKDIETLKLISAQLSRAKASFFR